jgi:hypothetical protein
LKKILSLFVCYILVITTLSFPKTTSANDICKGITYGQKIYWDGSILKSGQIGAVSIVKDTILYKLSGGSLVKEKILKAGTGYRIYNFKTNLLGVGGGYYVIRDHNITYKTPSKQKLQASACASQKTATNKPVTPPVVVDYSCTGITPGQKIKWDDIYMKPGQIGRVFVVKNTPLFKLTSSGLKQEKTLLKGTSYPIYNFKTGLLGVGGGYYVKRDNSITYKTPSKKKLQDLACATRKGVATQPSVPLHNKKPINLGPQVFNQSTIASKAGMDIKGNAYLYVILHGTPTSLVVVDINTNDIIGEYKLSDSTSAWGLDVDRSGTLWIGGTNSGTLYSYDPLFRKLVNHGHVLSGTNDTSIQDIFVNDQYVYGVTAYGANVFKYNKKSRKREFILPTQKYKQYAKSVAVDKDNKYLYVSSGSKAEMVQWNLSNHSKVSILPVKYKNETYVEKMKLIDNRYLVTKLYPSKKAGIYDIMSKKYINEFNSSSRGFSDKNTELNEFYYSYEGKFYAYHLGSGAIRETNASLPENTEALSLDLVRLKSNPDTNMLVGLVDNKGTYFMFNPKTNELALKKFEAPPQPVNLHLLFESPDQKHIYINGYMSGGLTQYDTIEKKGIQLNGISQLESSEFVNGKLYISAYPNARLTEINNPELPWEQRTTNVLVRLKDYGQERIPALTSLNNHLFAGTYPQYTTSGGLLLDYDLNTKTYKVYENYIDNQSIITLHPHGNYIYGGTSIHANYQKAKDGAKFFRFDPTNPEQKQVIPLPLTATMVMNLMTGPDKNIWGAADGTIFSYNPNNQQFKTVKFLPAISGRYGNADMLFGKDGFLYGTLEGRFFKMDPKTMAYTIIFEGGAEEIAQDANGNVYFKKLSTLYMYPLK